MSNQIPISNDKMTKNKSKKDLDIGHLDVVI